MVLKGHFFQTSKNQSQIQSPVAYLQSKHPATGEVGWNLEVGMLKTQSLHPCGFPRMKSSRESQTNSRPCIRLGDGNSNISYVHPENWGKWTHFDPYFSKGLVQPPTSRPFIIRGLFTSFSPSCNHVGGVFFNILVGIFTSKSGEMIPTWTNIFSSLKPPTRQNAGGWKMHFRFQPFIFKGKLPHWGLLVDSPHEIWTKPSCKMISTRNRRLPFSTLESLHVFFLKCSICFYKITFQLPTSWRDVPPPKCSSHKSRSADRSRATPVQAQVGKKKRQKLLEIHKNDPI